MSPRTRSKLLTTEDYWAIWLGMLVIGLAMITYYSGGTIKAWAVTPGKWNDLPSLGADLRKHWLAYLIIYLGFGTVFLVSMKAMGRNIRQFAAGYTVLFVSAIVIFYLAAWQVMKSVHLGAPLLALIIGLVAGNLKAMPEWFRTALRTEYYIKTGIVLLGATLPLTLILTAGPVAFLQATIVSITTWLTIYMAATRIFKLDPRFASVLGAGGAVCGVSGSIAIGGAVRADKEHISIGIAVVSVWAIVMILVLTVLTKFVVPDPISPGVAGAWVGTSEYADAAGFAVVAELATEHGDGPIHTFTLMKVIGRDIWIGIWALVLSIVSVVYWEKDRRGRNLGAGVVWDRFPKFVIGFFAASIIMSFIAANPPAGWTGKAKLQDTFKSHTEKTHYNADFSGYRVPAALADKFTWDAGAGLVTFKGKMSYDELDTLMEAATSSDQEYALKQLHYKSDWFESHLKSRAITPIKKLRSWAFVLCFLCIGLSTRFKELATFGLKPFWAFTVGVAVNVPLGFVLSQYVFRSFWENIR